MNIPIIDFLRSRVWRWIDSRRPTSATHHLNRNNLFIFPSQQGLWFLLVDILLWLLGTNYQNNLVLALAFLLITLLIVTILHSFNNLSGLTINAIGSHPVFCGDTAEVKVILSSRIRRFRDSISVKWQGGEALDCCLESDNEIAVNVFFKTHRRGWVDPGRLILQTYYPLGIIRSWARLKTGRKILVYPNPVSAGPLPLAEARSDQGVIAAGKGSDEFNGYKSYQAGDSLKHVSWKTYARGMGIYSKEFSSYRDQRLWLDWDYLAGKNTEERLSALCFWALEANRQGKEFGLRIPGIEIKISSGNKHLENVLKALALFGIRDVKTNDTQSDYESMKSPVNALVKQV